MGETKRVIIGGAGAGGLAVGAALAHAGHDVKILEMAYQPCHAESAAGQARRHAGAYYSSDAIVARKTILQSRSLDDFEGLVRKCSATYLVETRMVKEVCAAWEKAGVAFERETSLEVPLSRSARNFKLSAFRTQDGIINIEALRDLLITQALQAGAAIECDTRVISSEVKANRIVNIRVVVQGEERVYPCDIWINMTGAWLSEVEACVNPAARLDTLELHANPVLVLRWPFDFEPRIIQFYGNQLFDHLSIIPSVQPASSMVAVATTGGISIEHTNEVASLQKGNQREQGRLSELLQWAFRDDLILGFDEQHLRWCVRSSLWDRLDPSRTTRIALVMTTRDRYGGVANSCVGSPGKLGNVMALKERVLAEVAKCIFS